jgi:N-acetylneuraminic acid mutarotase
VDGILYVIGGHYPYGNLLRTVWAYDPQTDSWTQKANMPTARRFLAAAAVDGIIYVIGGSGGPFSAPVILRTVEAYDPKTDTWATNKADMPTARGALAVCALDGIIYAIGGSSGWPTRLATVEAYDPMTNQWTPRSSLPKGLMFLTASAANGFIYAFMGTETFAYDPNANHWTAKAQFSPWSWGLMSATVDGIIYLFGGMTEDLYGSFDLTLAYDPAQDRFSARRKMLRTRLLSACGVIDGKVYLAGGVSKEPVVNPDAVYYKALEVFDPQGGVTPQIVSLTCEGSNNLRLVWQGEAGLLYGVQSTRDIANGPWTRATFSTGSNSVLATNTLVEATCLVPTTDTNRFFRVLEP